MLLAGTPNTLASERVPVSGRSIPRAAGRVTLF
jgi:hypothetical protein